jgi:hypothetical protein
MQENRISITVSPEDLEALQTAVATMQTILAPYLITLNPTDRQTLAKMNNASLPFVQKVMDYATTNPQFVPAYIDLPELKKDVDAVDTLLQIYRPLEQLFTNLDHTVMLCGSEAYVASLTFYNSVKQAAKLNVLGAEPIANDLKTGFEVQGKKKTDPEPPKAN